MTVTEERVTTTPFRMFAVRVARVQRLSPSFVRITFTGEDLDLFADNGFDQRIKLVLPLPGLGLAPLPTGPDWYSAWRSLPEEMRNPVRTYTAGAVRPGLREVDVDMVLHGETGPASRFAVHARPGDEAALLGPDATYPGRQGGVEFAPPEGYRGPLLLAGDETALPAVAGILARLPRESFGRVVLEVPHADDRLDLDAPVGVEVTWAVRGQDAHGSHLVRLVRQAVSGPGTSDGVGAPAHQGDADEELLWDVPDPATHHAEDGDLYAWLAGEASTIRAIRRHLVTELGHDRRAVSFMGYWREGRAEH